ncbi:MAG: hypothetical protein IJY22_08385 [Clostridia bacterium]|nr:hypothetical protein [Clostridia bacterium]
MQLTGPLFLFILLPLSLCVLHFFPLRHRRMALSLFSVIWYVLINYGNLSGLLHVALLILSALLLVYLPLPHSAKIAKLRTTIGVLIPVLSFLAARLLAEYGCQWYIYPIGLAYISLGSVSLAVDMARGDTVRPKNPVDVVGYLLFFPILVAGPIIQSKHYFDNTEKPCLSSKMLSIGARRYMIGFIKRIAMAAVLLRALRQLMEYVSYMISIQLVLLLLAVSYLAFYFFFTGTADMARGICAMFGIPVERDRGHILSATSPDRLVCGIALSLYRFMLDYVYRPLRRVLPFKKGWITARILMFVLSVLFLRTRPEMLLFALPMLLLLLISMLRRKRARLWLRILLTPVTVLACSFFTLAIMMDEPMKMFTLFSEAFRSTTDFHLYHIFEAVRDFRYLLVAVTIFLILIPVTYLRTWFLRKANVKVAITVRYVSLALLFSCFVASLFYLMPQFPGYADQAYGFYQYTR